MAVEDRHGEEVTLEGARERVARAIAEYGRPDWVAAVTKADRDAVGAVGLRELLGEAAGPPMRLADKRAAIMLWAKDNLFAEVTAAQMGETVGVAAATAKKVMEARPDVFKPIGRGTYEVRDAEADRQFARATGPRVAKKVKVAA